VLQRLDFVLEPTNELILRSKSRHTRCCTLMGRLDGLADGYLVVWEPQRVQASLDTPDEIALYRAILRLRLCNLSKLCQSGFEILHGFGCDDVGWGKVVSVFQRAVAEPEDVE
jgi:hypothetical protein